MLKHYNQVFDPTNPLHDLSEQQFVDCTRSPTTSSSGSTYNSGGCGGGCGEREGMEGQEGGSACCPPSPPSCLTTISPLMCGHSPLEMPPQPTLIPAAAAAGGLRRQ
jgi:hypothetical protein